jgi:condensin complex subunit 2
MDDIPEGQVDEAYWASKEAESHVHDSDDAPQGQYDADFFQDDGLGAAGPMDDDDDNFADARDHFSPPVEGIGNEAAEGGPGPPLDGAYGAQLVTQSRRLRPEYVQYARVAKKVDVRRLKEEIWRGLAFEEVGLPSCELEDVKTDHK